MNFGWEKEEDRITRYMKIPPRKKLEWLLQMHEFTMKASTKRIRMMRQKLREAH